jgi:hypothetical protein
MSCHLLQEGLHLFEELHPVGEETSTSYNDYNSCIGVINDYNSCIEVINDYNSCIGVINDRTLLICMD